MHLFSTLLIALAALSFYAAANHLYIALRKRGDLLNLTFGLMSLCVVGSIAGNYLIATSSAAGEVVAFTRFRVVCVTLSTAVLPWFASYYTGFRPRPFLVSFSILIVLFLMARMADPLVLTYHAIHDPGILILPWGERISVFHGTPNIWMQVYFLSGFIAIGFMYVAAVIQFRAGERARAVALASAVTFLVAAVAHDTAVILLRLRWILVGDFGWLSMVILLGFRLTGDIIRAGEIKKSLIESERAIRKSEEKYRLLAENVTDVIWTMDTAMRITYISPSVERLNGWSPRECMSLRLDDFITPGSMAVIGDTYRNAISGMGTPGFDPNRVYTLELEQYRKDGSSFWSEIRTRFLWDGGHEPAGMIGVTRDISARRKAEDMLRGALEEKNVLIREIHHRVKNNLQVIVSLLNLQGERHRDPALRAMLNESISRIHSMSLVHESMYQSDNFSYIDIRGYIERLVGMIISTYAGDPKTITREIAVDDVTLPVSQAVPFALLLNELLANALRHGIAPGGDSGYIGVSLRRAEDLLVLEVADRGPGMDVRLLEEPDSGTLGMRIIRALVNQLSGTVSLTVDGGCRFRVEFPGE